MIVFVRNILKGVRRERRYLEEHKRLWKSQNSEEGRNRFFAERVWRHQCYLREAWEARRGPRRGRTHHCLHKLSSPTWEKDQSPSSSSSLFQWTQKITEKEILEFVYEIMRLCVKTKRVFIKVSVTEKEAPF